jgi:molybdopterin/thiamine biosynthesis adenylyltransferase
MTDDSQDRYARHRLLEKIGWDQSVIDRSRITITPMNLLSCLYASLVVPLGMNVKLYDGSHVDKKHFFHRVAKQKKGDMSIEGLTKLFHKINQDVNVIGLSQDIIYPNSIPSFGRSDVIFEGSNDVDRKKALLAHAQSTGKPMISATSNGHLGSLVLLSSLSGSEIDDYFDYLQSYETHRQKAIMSLPIAGLAAEMTRRLVMPLPEDIETPTQLYFNFKSAEITSEDPNLEEVIELPGSKYFRDKTVVLVGAGAIGVWDIFIADLGIKKLIIVDYDKIEKTNLPRTPWYFGKVGKYKAPQLGKVVKKNFGKVQVQEHIGKVGIEGILILEDGFEIDDVETGEVYDVFGKEKVDLILGATDNFRARRAMNGLAVKYGIPYIDGGSLYNESKAVNVHPELGLCLRCNPWVPVDEQAAQEDELLAQHCFLDPVGSIAISNALSAAGALYQSMFMMLDPKQYPRFEDLFKDLSIMMDLNLLLDL